MEILLMAIGIIALLVVLFIYSAFSWGFVAMKMYTWFVLSIPALHSFPEFTFMQWVGLMLFIGIIKHTTPEFIKDEYKESSGKRFGIMAGSPWLVLAVGWMFKSFFF